jgi:hypothetical protein
LHKSSLYIKAFATDKSEQKHFSYYTTSDIPTTTTQKFVSLSLPTHPHGAKLAVVAVQFGPLTFQVLQSAYPELTKWMEKICVPKLNKTTDSCKQKAQSTHQFLHQASLQQSQDFAL